MENQVLWHERDISNSAAERVICPDATTAVHFMLHRLAGLLENAGLIAARMGRIEKAKTLMEIAAGRSLSETKARIWLISYYVREDNIEQLLINLSLVLEVANLIPADVRIRLMDGLAALAASPQTTEASPQIGTLWNAD